MTIKKIQEERIKMKGISEQMYLLSTASFQGWALPLALLSALTLCGGLLGSNIFCHVFYSLGKLISTCFSTWEAHLFGWIPVWESIHYSSEGIRLLRMLQVHSYFCISSCLPWSTIQKEFKLQTVQHLLFAFTFMSFPSPLMFPANLVTDNKLTDLRTEYITEMQNASPQNLIIYLFLPSFLPNKQEPSSRIALKFSQWQWKRQIKFNFDRCKVIKTRKDQDPACIHNDGLWIGY